MKQTHTFLFIISILGFLITTPIYSQEEEVIGETAIDSITHREKYGIRLGIDLSKPLRTLLQDDYSGFEVVGDYRVYGNFYAAAEIGNEQLGFTGDNISVTSRGSYIKLGTDYNAYNNWEGMQNSIFAGFRYGFSTFSQDLEEYTVYSTSQYFGTDIRQETIESSGLTASWVELMVGIKVELFNNLFLSANLQLKRRITQTTPSGFDNLTIPGFNRTYDESSVGVGYGYSISYLIPFYQKAKD